MGSAAAGLSFAGLLSNSREACACGVPSQTHLLIAAYLRQERLLWAGLDGRTPITDNRQLSSFNFGDNNVSGVSAAQSFTLTDIGSASLVFTNSSIASSSGNSSAFTTAQAQSVLGVGGKLLTSSR